MNKLSSAIRLSFVIAESSLPDRIKQRLLALSDHRISADGIVMIRAESSRSQAANKAEALARLQSLVDQVSTEASPRKATQPGRAARQRRLDAKSARGRIKRMRGRVDGSD